MRKLTIEQVKEQALKEYNLVLVSNEYVDSKKPLEWHYIDDNITFKRSWSNIKSGYTGTKNINNYESDKKFIESYKDLEYKLEQTEKEYLSANRIGANDRVFIVSNKKIPGLWKATKRNFERSAETHLNNSGMNFGELLIYSILVNNNIKFIQEYKVSINGKTNIFDFYVPEYNLYIEYDGIQHYNSIGYFGGDISYSDRISRDRSKDLYVKSNNASIARIPYTCSSQEEIIDCIKRYITSTLIIGKTYFSGKIKEVAKYYSTHSSKETCDRYGINRTTVNKYYKLVYGKAKVYRSNVTV